VFINEDEDEDDSPATVMVSRSTAIADLLAQLDGPRPALVITRGSESIGKLFRLRGPCWSGES
jgi:hypothetical protein